MLRGPKTIKIPIIIHLLPYYIRLQNTHGSIKSSLLPPKSFSLPFTPKPFDKMPQRDIFSQICFLSRALFLARHCLIEPNLDIVVGLHCLALKTGALANVSTPTSLLTLYGKAGDLGSAWCLFNETTSKDVICWNAMINACVYGQCFESAVTLFKEMMKDALGFDSITLLIVLSALSRSNSLEQGRVLHGISLKRHIDSNCFLPNALMDMYSNCGDLSSAESIFMRMEFRDTISWNSMICGYLHNTYPEKALKCFKQMSFSGVRADDVSLSCIISACSCLGELRFGESVHGCGVKLGYDELSHVSVANALISFYSECDRFHAAEKVFLRLNDKDVVTWNSMIDGLSKKGRVLEAIDLLHKMQLTRTVQPDSVTLMTILPLCSEFSLLRQGRSIHGFSIRRKLGLDLSLTNSLLDMYIKCDCLKLANLLFNSMHNRDLISWNIMIGGYSHDGFLKEAGVLFRDLLHSGLRCGLSTLLAILPSCNCHEALQFGKSIHCLMFKSGFSLNVPAINALMFMYINCGDMVASLLLFRSISVGTDLISWNTVIVGYAQNGYFIEALEAFNQMRQPSVINPDSITLVSILSACGNLELVFYGKCIHGLALKTLTALDLRVRNALLTMYCKCGDIGGAESLFHTIHNRNLCSWNCMISGFAQNKDARRAFDLFHHLEFKPNVITIVSILSACTQLGALRHGREINGYALRFGHHQNVFVSAALVDMYSKCGRLEIANRIFQKSAEKSVATWNSVISAFGYHGYGRKAIKLFSEMRESGTMATKSTFISLLSACSHSGLVDEGWEYYNRMSEEFGVIPTTEHHVCVVDMLGRAGRLSEAYEFIKQIPTRPAPGVWGALLSACKEHGNLEMGKSVAEHLFLLEPKNVGYYVSLSNMYAAAGKWSNAVEVRRMIRDRGLRKPPGCSLIDVCSR
ncbi:tetratricopeptide repeat (TPR)-like superfamily protein [Tasmannia lanceolata]|uniref:tetratricopeptide repeat (TPR)-like superfamily protein n=1 Tax=Tasmannia lanceolata TaxID=3420 RepID=UPI004063946D